MRPEERESLRQRFQFRCGYCGVSERSNHRARKPHFDYTATEGESRCLDVAEDGPCQRGPSLARRVTMLAHIRRLRAARAGPKGRLCSRLPANRLWKNGSVGGAKDQAGPFSGSFCADLAEDDGNNHGLPAKYFRIRSLVGRTVVTSWPCVTSRPATGKEQVAKRAIVVITFTMSLFVSPRLRDR
jgi:hypothetical protein